MTSIRQATPQELPTVCDLFWQYLQWANGKTNESFQVSVDTATVLEHDMDGIVKFMSPLTDCSLLLRPRMLPAVSVAERLALALPS